MTSEISNITNPSTIVSSQNELSQEQIETLANDANLILFSSYYSSDEVNQAKEDINSLLESSDEYIGDESQEYLELAQALYDYTNGEAEKSDCFSEMSDIFIMQNKELGYSEQTLKAITTAFEEIGTAENTDKNGYGDNAGDVLKYGGNAGEAWCAKFVSWLYGDGQNADNSSTFGYEYAVSALMEDAVEAGYYESKDTYTPVAGDIMILKSGGESHVGIVYNVDENYVYTIEGNKFNEVRSVVYDKNGSYYQNYVTGYAKMNEWTEGSSDNELNTDFLPALENCILPDSQYYVKTENGNVVLYTDSSNIITTALTSTN